MGKQKEILRKVTLLLKVRSILVKQCLAECLGTLIHTMLGCGAIAQFTLSCGTHTEFLSVTFAIGFAVALGILVTSKVSEKLWLHSNKQLTVIGPNSTAGIFTTFPLEHVSAITGIFDQAAGTAVLIFCILTIVDPLHTPVRTGLEAFTIGLVVLITGWSMGSNSQYSLNPARDIGPRLFTAIAGWGSEVFTWCGLHPALISTSATLSVTTRRDRRKRDSQSLQKSCGKFSQDARKNLPADFVTKLHNSVAK
ncbi:aquaporin-3-like isoform X5 [Hemitrygon akajei]|uniref:aquaporin-3-like isoform X5 n=1 Tax=Hemitrygon akajei TaxID=2704970 RepID=UPI003BF98315